MKGRTAGFTAGYTAVFAVALALGAAGPGSAQERFATLADGAGGLWVVDGAGDRVARCREAAAASPRVLGGQATPRPRGGAGEEPVCTGWVAIAAPAAAVRPKVIGAGG
ncbi:MAG: hypothetical protein QM699_04775 [Amaricoccus sp.]|uniref:hypothetical protein n=1 Tax=Amaricoccus sp. TaxID=1872485 RepID=UPI0039E5CA22